MTRDHEVQSRWTLENGEAKEEKRWKMCLYGEEGFLRNWGLLLVGAACRRGGPWKWLMQAVSTGSEDSLSGVGNEVSVVIKGKVSMAM